MSKRAEVFNKIVDEEFSKYGCVSRYGQEEVSYNRAEFFPLVKQIYEQAEKDLALTVDDIRQIVKINYEIIFQDTTGIKCGDVAEETLKRFNEWREKK